MGPFRGSIDKRISSGRENWGTQVCIRSLLSCFHCSHTILVSGDLPILLCHHRRTLEWGMNFVPIQISKVAILNSHMKGSKIISEVSNLQLSHSPSCCLLHVIPTLLSSLWYTGLHMGLSSTEPHPEAPRISLLAAHIKLFLEKVVWYY